MNDLEPRPNDYVDSKCPFCKSDVEYLSMAWHIVTTRLGRLARRRMGPCSNCGRWLKPILVWPDEGDGMRGWLLEAVDPYEIEQVTMRKKPPC